MRTKFQSRWIGSTPKSNQNLRVIVCAAALIGLLGSSRIANAQALPAAEASPISTGFALPVTAGDLRYGVSASESLNWGYYSGSSVATYSNVTGDLGYISDSLRQPFSMVLAGGGSWSSNGGQPAYGFASLALSQVINVGRWKFVAANSVDYLPESPTTSGLIGLPGLGDLGLSPIQTGIPTGQGVLSKYSTRVDDTPSASIERQITGKTALNASGQYNITRFLDNNGPAASQGIDSDGWDGNGGLTHQFSVRNSISGNYGYSHFEYSGAALFGLFPNFDSQTATLAYSHQFTRKLKVSAAAGPQWTRIQYFNTSNSLDVFANVNASYAGEFSALNASYVRGTNSGYGVIAGARSDSIMGGYNRIINRVWSAAASVGYSRTSSLATLGILPFNFDTTVFGIQTSRALGHNLSGYASYTLENQSGSGSPNSIITDYFSGRAQVLSFGVTYSPMAIHIGRR